MDVATHELPIDWPEPLSRPAGADRLRWGIAVAAAAAEVAANLREAPPIARLDLDEPFVVQGIALSATLVFELDRLVRVELSGPLDALALAALGVDGAAAPDVGHYRLSRGATTIVIDALDGVVALEPDVEHSSP